jgi:transcriptional regulator with XRE-family HTH domain
LERYVTKRRSAIAHYNTLNQNRSPGELAVYEEFGRRLQARMIALGWNQSELSRRATEHLPKVSKGQVQGHSLGRDRISSYIRGKYLPRPEALEAIAKALKCKSEDLLPAEKVPSVIVRDDSPLSDFKMLPDGRYCIRLNRVVSQRTATAIMTLLSEENGGA